MSKSLLNLLGVSIQCSICGNMKDDQTMEISNQSHPSGERRVTTLALVQFIISLLKLFKPISVVFFF